MDITLISDLHGYYPKLHGGDLLIVAGDLTACDLGMQYAQFRNWLCNQEYTKKIVITGNHDNLIANGRWNIDPPEGFEYLCDSGTEFEGLKIYGSPWTKTFPNMNSKCKAFTVDTEEELYNKFVQIPADTDILITHSPAYGIFDSLERYTAYGKTQEYVGSMSLRNISMKIKPKIHVFGHIHEHGGKLMDTGLTKFVNASHVNEVYEPINKPIRIIL
jgi:Icc-related predicted phosphoesterase